MSLSPLIPDPAVTEDEWPFKGHAPGSPENMLDQAVWLAQRRERQAMANVELARLVERMNAEHRAAKAQRAGSQEPRRAPRATDRDYLDGDYEMVGTIQSSDWGD